jgi:acetylornithine deacetylase/succinyl-diaminopimelate desuccinylase-like protein
VRNPGDPDLPVPDPGALDLDALDRAIDDLTQDAFRFLERLVAAPSPVGAEETAQQIVRDELDRVGFTTAATPVAEDIAADPVAGVPQLPYAGRHNVVGHLVHRTGPSLILNGHIDVVPAEAQLWSVPPFTPVRRGGWLLGRGAGDMKGGFALGSTTDARIYLNQFGVPAVAYGPRARNIHGTDEAVELDSIVAGARTLARFLAAYYAGGGLPPAPVGPGQAGAGSRADAAGQGGEVAR